MKTLISLFLLTVVLVVLGVTCESYKDPYEVGTHWDYSIVCENGFTYKSLSNRRGALQIFNSDGTPLKCGEKIY